MAKISTRGTDVRDAIAARKPFTTHGAFAAETAQGDVLNLYTGRLASEYVAAIKNEQPSYIVFSYATPIAWWSEVHGWTVPPVKYSATTSKHQYQVRYALAGI